jgi:hypothetical protein
MTGASICGNPAAVALSQFSIDWDPPHVTWPAGQRSAGWAAGRPQEGTAVIRVNFAMPVGMACPRRARCTHALTRGLT